LVNGVIVVHTLFEIKRSELVCVQINPTPSDGKGSFRSPSALATAREN